MKKQDFLFIFVLVIIFLPFFVSEPVYDWYKSFNAAHGMVMSFIKFGILATLGEMLVLRISAGVYNRKGFGVLPRAVVWGLLGMGINAAMIIFSKGVPQFMEYMGMANAAAIINGEFCLDKLWIAFAISVAMNTIFAPVFSKRLLNYILCIRFFIEVHSIVSASRFFHMPTYLRVVIECQSRFFPFFPAFSRNCPDYFLHTSGSSSFRSLSDLGAR